MTLVTFPDVIYNILIKVSGLVLRFFDQGRGLTQEVGYLTEKPKMLKLPIFQLEVSFLVCMVSFGQDKKV